MRGNVSRRELLNDFRDPVDNLTWQTMAKLLVIDDDEQVRYFLRRTLEKEGHEVSEAADGVEGLKTFHLGSVALVFCDLIMPNKEGLETIRELRGIDPNVKIIAISGGFHLTGTDFLPLAKALGAVKVLRKPFHRSTIVDVLHEFLPAEESPTA
jgi:CheY-like chemotaxis protein